MILLLTPPFTQLNTPYPATAYLKGFLNTKGYDTYQMDLGIETILALFTADSLHQIFTSVEEMDIDLSDNAFRIFCLANEYIHTIGPVIAFLQNKNPTLAHAICGGDYLPKASRFNQLDDLQWAFGTMGTADKARHLATLYLEDLADFIKETIDPHFGFSRYAESLGLALSDFSSMNTALESPNSLISKKMLEILEEKVQSLSPAIVCLSVPFPGNLFAALKCGQYLKKHHPHIKIIMGGGYPNTELRRLSEIRVFEYIDFVSLDDGEAPLLCLLEYIEGKRELNELKRIFTKKDGKVVYINRAKEKDVAQRDTGTPDYSDLLINDYLSVIEIANPMHRLWSDGRWNKLTLAHGCYWGKCSFCDITLDYIKNYEPLTAQMLCDRIETIIEQTGQNGFHFVDEAAPPALLKSLSLEIVARKLTVVWWTNIRFEKSFTPDLCKLLKAAGCIAVSGGLEVASDRLLERMKKGVTVAQVARVSDAFTKAGIMVHAYLMYGFPTQTAQETIDSLEMVRQMFKLGIVQSGFWHRFAMTAHSPVGLHPAEFEVTKVGPSFEGFADNDLEHQDPLGCEHHLFSEGLKKSLFNYMHGICFDFPLSNWFDFDTPPPTVPKSYIRKSLRQKPSAPRPNAIIVWLGNLPSIDIVEQGKGKKKKEIAELLFHNKRQESMITCEVPLGKWLYEYLPQIWINAASHQSFQQFKEDFQSVNLGDFDTFLYSPTFKQLQQNGLLIL